MNSMHLFFTIIPYCFKICLAMPGEQGIEGIHAEFNTLRRTYSSIRNPVNQLKCIMEEHHRRCNPANIVLKPQVNHRKKKKKNSVGSK
jgi:hypothetical protein